MSKQKKRKRNASGGARKLVNKPAKRKTASMKKRGKVHKVLLTVILILLIGICATYFLISSQKAVIAEEIINHKAILSEKIISAEDVKFYGNIDFNQRQEIIDKLEYLINTLPSKRSKQLLIDKLTKNELVILFKPEGYLASVAGQGLLVKSLILNYDLMNIGVDELIYFNLLHECSHLTRYYNGFFDRHIEMVIRTKTGEFKRIYKNKRYYAYAVFEDEFLAQKEGILYLKENNLFGYVTSEQRKYIDFNNLDLSIINYIENTYIKDDPNYSQFSEYWEDWKAQKIEQIVL